MFPDAAYQQETMQPACGDVLAICTDGISDAMNGLDDDFGEDRDAVMAATDSHVGGAPQHDDMTVVIARVL